MNTTNHSMDTARRISLVVYLKNRATPPTYWVAAKELGVDEKTLREDIEFMRFVGLCEFGTDPLDTQSVKIELKEDTKTLELVNPMGLVKPLRLSLAEAGALVLKLEQLRNTPGIAEPEVIDSALEKLQKICGKRLDVIIRGDDPENDPDAAALHVIADCREKKIAFGFDYLKEDGDKAESRTIDPYVVFSCNGHRYVAGFDRDREKPRNFRLDRVSRPHLTGIDRDPRADKFAFNDSDPFDFDEASIAEAVVDGALRWLADYEPIAINKSPRADGLYRATIRWHNRDWLTSFVLSHGGGITVEGPDQLRDTIAQRARKARAAYPD